MPSSRGPFMMHARAYQRFAVFFEREAAVLERMGLTAMAARRRFTGAFLRRRLVLR